MDVAVSFNINQSLGYANITPFQFTSSINPVTNVVKVLWNFGDSTTSTEFNPIHTYEIPGTYVVYLTVFVKDQDPIVYSKNVEVKLLLNESIYFDFIPPPTFAGHYNRYPFRLHITSSDLRDHYIDLGVQFSRSSPPSENPSKWDFLKPQWKFFDLQGNQIKQIKTTDTPILVNSKGQVDPKGTIVAGVTGYAEFYFSDDIYNFDLAINNEPYSTIIATLQTQNIDLNNLQHKHSISLSGFANSLAIATCPYINLWRTPDYLKITENGIISHANPRWSTSQIPLIVNSFFLQEYPDDHPDGNGITPIRKESFFVHNFPLSPETDIPLNIGLDSLSSNFFPTPKFSWTDETLHKTPGYYKGFFDVPDVNTFGARITASAEIAVPALTGNYINPLLWVSNPEAGMFSTVQYNYQKNLAASLSQNLSTAHVFSFRMPLTQGLSGNHGIHSVAALPAPQYHAWLLDSDLQYLYRVNTRGDILSSINIREIVESNQLGYLIPNTVSPASVVLDGDYNIWLTLYDSTSTIKLDKNGNFLFAVSPLDSLAYVLPVSSNLPYNLEALSLYDQESYFYTPAALSAFDDINLVEPSFIDTDINGNAWISYTNAFSGLLLKYSSEGELLTQISFPSHYIPEELVCDNLNNFWIYLSDPNSSRCYIERRNYDGQLFTNDQGAARRFGPFYNINGLTIDADQNLWFTNSYRSVTKINANNYSVSTLEVTGANSFLVNDEDTALEGICADVTGKIYVVNSIENQIYVIDNNSFSVENYFTINPQGFVFYTDNQNNLQTFYGKYNKSAAVGGDWSGFRWINKYANTKLPFYNSTPYTTTIYGKSPMLDFYINDQFAYDIFKVNENYNLAQQMKAVALTPALENNEFLFDNFLGSIFGGLTALHSDPGTAVYEKIANFVSDHSDIDTCNIDQLYSLAHMTDLNTDDFRLNYPESIARLINLASINPNRLWGASHLDTLKFSSKNYGEFTNLGLPLSLSYTVSAGVPVVLREKSLIDKYKLIYTGRVNKNATYSLDTLANFLELGTDWHIYYDFHEYIIDYTQEQTNDIIDWSNPQTSVHRRKSTSYINSLGDAPVETFDPTTISISDNNGDYPSITNITKVDTEITIVSDGDPYPGKAGVINFTNDGVSPRTGFLSSDIKKQEYNYTFVFKGGSNSLSYHDVKFDPIGITSTGVLLYGPMGNSPILPGTSTSVPSYVHILTQFYWNKVFLSQNYPTDEAGGSTDANGLYYYTDGRFLNTAWQDYKVWSKNSYYNNSAYNSDHFRHLDGHSKIIGFCFDGYPIYGPYGYTDQYKQTDSSVMRMKSGYRLNSTETAGRLPDYSYADFAAGSFVNDYTFVTSTSAGYLDAYNGRFCVTPEYPLGTYAYFLTFTDDSLSTPAYPYITGPRTKQRRSTSRSNKLRLPFSMQEWEGRYGILETMLSYELYKGLDLLK